MTRSNTEKQIASLTDQDILIIPELGDLTSTDFNRYHDAFTAGSTAATKQLDQLKRLAISPTDYAQHMSKHNTDYFRQPAIDFVRINDNSILDDELLRARLDIKSGDLLDTDSIDKSINEIYALGIYSHVGYTIVEEDGKTGLKINATEKPWGTSGIEFGLDLSTDMDGESVFNIAAAYTMKPMNGLNGEWRSVVQLGENPILATEWYQPLDTEEKYFINPILQIERMTVNNFLGSKVFSRHQVKQTFMELWAGRNFGNLARLRVGYRRGTGSVSLKTGDPTDPRLRGGDFDSGDLLAEFQYDTLNNIAFPTTGSSFTLNYAASRESIGADHDFDQAGFTALGHILFVAAQYYFAALSTPQLIISV